MARSGPDMFSTAPLARILTVGRAAVCIGIISATLSVSGQEPLARLDVRVAVAPTPFKGSDGQTHLAYELVINDVPRMGIQIERIDVFAEPDAKPRITYSGTDLDQRVMRPGADPKVRYGRAISSGTTALIHGWITIAEDRVPRVLRHSFQISTEGGQPLIVADARVDVRTTPPVSVGSPFRAGTWLAHNGPGQHRSAHWGSALLEGGTARIPQRYAIDFIGVDDNWKAVRGDFRKSSNDDWIGFGQDILAVIDGTVYAARDGIIDNPPLVEPPRPSSPSAQDSYGNYVIVRTGDGRFVHYVHLQRNSVAVKAGEAVRRGQVIGRLGNSGNTNGAHLHFNITEGPEQEATQGIPFVFDTVQTLGNTTADIALGAEPSADQTRSPPTTYQRILPLDGAVVRFR